MTASESVDLTRAEAAHLLDLVSQFAQLLEDADGTDPAIARLTPTTYQDDPTADADLREVSRGDLLDRRTADAALVVSALRASEGTVDAGIRDSVVIHLDPAAVGAWMRTLAALRLVLAARLGIVSESDYAPEDPRFAVYDWLGYRLEELVRTTDPDSQGRAKT